MNLPIEYPLPTLRHACPVRVAMVNKCGLIESTAISFI